MCGMKEEWCWEFGLRPTTDEVAVRVMSNSAYVMGGQHSQKTPKNMLRQTKPCLDA